MYLAARTDYGIMEITEDSRQIPSGGKQYNYDFLVRLKCVKDLYVGDYLTQNFVNAVCPANEWKRHIDGMDPIRAYENDRYEKNRIDNRKNLHISIAILIGTIILISLTAILIYIEVQS